MTISTSVDDSVQEIIYEGPVSIVARVQLASGDGSSPTQCLAVKSSTTNKRYAKEPHDILREARLIGSVSHSNIIPLIKQEFIERSQTLRLWMPYVPFSLSDLLSSPTFSPLPLISFSFSSFSSTPPTPREQSFLLLAKSIQFQILSGIAYLHQTTHIAHRDIKPSNVRLTDAGCVQIVDFGVAMRVVGDEEEEEGGEEERGDMWAETRGRMYFQVSTGAYRAPELLFGPQTYDAFAIDSWSLGAMFAEFFTPLRLVSGEDEDEDEYEGRITSDSDSTSNSDEDSNPQIAPFIIPPTVRPTDPRARWTRDSLFDGERGEIGLAWSIFKIRGSPDESRWPSFNDLPDAGKVSFIDAEPTDLARLLPNLPPSTVGAAGVDTTTHSPAPTSVASTPLDLLHRFLVYEPPRRLRPTDALHHPWFTATTASDQPGGMILLPEGYAAPSTSSANFIFSWQNKSLGEVMRGCGSFLRVES
ncbi:kinase-like protein [Phlebopus sp. FC_14]|nr:kinase-like protein [Phlebopus sp. FC_14]